MIWDFALPVDKIQLSPKLYRRAEFQEAAVLHFTSDLQKVTHAGTVTLPLTPGEMSSFILTGDNAPQCLRLRRIHQGHSQVWFRRTFHSLVLTPESFRWHIKIDGLENSMWTAIGTCTTPVSVFTYTTGMQLFF